MKKEGESNLMILICLSTLLMRPSSNSDSNFWTDGKAWCSALLNEGCHEGVPDEDRVVLSIPDENPDIWEDGSLEVTSSLLSLELPTL